MSESSSPHRRRPRYRGKNPRRFAEKYKEHDPARYSATVAKVIAAGKTPAGAHRPVMVAEILGALAPQPGEIAIDCTLGYGGHAEEILTRLQPGGHLLGLDADPIELPKTAARLRSLGFDSRIFTSERTNFAGLPQALARAGLNGADIILADLGVSSMQLDDPARGFSAKHDGPLDLRMNPQRGPPASLFLQKIERDKLVRLLLENADEPHAAILAPVLAGRLFPGTGALSAAIRANLPRLDKEAADLSVRRVFQALRIAVNDEFSALDTFLRNLPMCMSPGGRVAILTFHSGEDRRVKKAFAAGLRDGSYARIATEVIRPTAAERHSNPRSTSAKLRWAQRGPETNQAQSDCRVRAPTVSLAPMKILISTTVLTLALLGLTPLLRAQDADKDVDAALKQAGEAAKKMGMKMPDVKKVMEESDKEEAKEKAAKQAVVDAPGPARPPAWTPKVPQFTSTGPVAKELVDGEPAVVEKGTSPLTPAELGDAWEKAVTGQQINHSRNNMTINGAITVILYLSARSESGEEVRLEARRDPGEKISRVMVISPLPVPTTDDED